MDFDPLLLSRIQFGFTIAFHIFFPAFTIGLASWLAALELRWLLSGDPVYRTLYRFWVKIFAVSFGLGVVSGVVMSYQFGTNWSRYADFVAPVLGPLFSYEVLTAFFLEASFLGIMLFGWERVGDRLHFVATGMVALGTLFSAFWILSANSWMQTPAGHAIVDGRAVPVDWWAVVFNPSFPYRLAHMVMACYLTTAFAVAGMAAWLLLKGRAVRGARISLSMALWFAALFAPVQVVLGDLQGLNVLEHQPTKLAAIEGLWRGGAGVPFVLFAWPDQAAEANRFALEIPRLGSLLLTHDLDGFVEGLDAVPPAERPPVAIVFWSFRLMVGLGLAMVALGAWSLWLRWRGRLFDGRAFLWACAAMAPSGFLAVLFGWITAEVGRQPWVVYGLMRTADAVSPAVSGGAVALSLTVFFVVYTAMFGAGTYYLLKLLRRGPEPDEEIRGEPPAKTPERPLSVPDEAVEGPPGRPAPAPAG